MGDVGRWPMRLAREAALGLWTILALNAGWTAQVHAQAQAPTASWWDRYIRQSRLFRLPDGRALNLYCEGSGAPR